MHPTAQYLNHSDSDHSSGRLYGYEYENSGLRGPYRQVYNREVRQNCRSNNIILVCCKPDLSIRFRVLFARTCKRRRRSPSLEATCARWTTVQTIRDTSCRRRAATGKPSSSASTAIPTSTITDSARQATITACCIPLRADAALYRVLHTQMYESVCVRAASVCS